MLKKLLPLTAFLFFLINILVAQNAAQKEVLTSIDNKSEHYWKIARTIWEYAELGYLEFKSSKLLQDELAREGFKVDTGVADIPTAFIASYGSGEPIIGILAEFDALPGISQDVATEPKKRPGCIAAHACGHHLFGTASSAAAIAIKEWLEKSGTEGTIRLYGTPAEEGGGGKVYMVRAGLFDDVDAMLHWHPDDENEADASSSLANKSAKFRFYGIASHAAAAPENGRSALDAVEAMNFMVNQLREHVPMESRIHYVITRGGEAPNVVPAFAEVFYYCRHPEMDMVKENFERIVKCAEGAALGSDVRMDYEVIHGLYNLLPNEKLARLMYKNLKIVGGVHYDEEETGFAERIAMNLAGKNNPPISSAKDIKDFEIIEKGRGGSTDVGDVSWVVPTAGLSTATWVPGTSAHTWQAVAAGGMTIGKKGAINAAKTLALTGIDLFNNPSICEEAKMELDRRRGNDFYYAPLLGDREPPLDYRK